uniref:Uncharacterized protein n=1 Tax=Tanacetum cinerariifolium TaxID=118510 RepID=A0A6L2K2M2_TANCI|nr:hypothetical protein [Tanacetum cinerariifolium]
MAGEGPANMIARRVDESRTFVNRMCDEAATAQDYVAQLTALIAKLQAIKDQEEVHDSFWSPMMLRGYGYDYVIYVMNVYIVATGITFWLCPMAPIIVCRKLICVWMLDVDVTHLLGVVFSDIIIGLLIIVDWCNHLVDCMLYYVGSVEGCSTARLQLFLLSMGPFFILDKLGKVAESPRLPDKMRVAFTQARKEEASFAALMCVCCSLRVSLSKKCMLAAKLEGLKEQGNAVRAFENIKEIVSRDFVTLGLLEQLLAHAQVGVDLKDGYLADVEEKV